MSELSEVERAVTEHRRGFTTHWRDKPDSYWLARLMEEVGELAGSLVGDHDDPPEWELTQIAGICINWLEMRAALRPSQADGGGQGETG